MEFKRDHAQKQKVGQSRWQIFTIGFLLFVFLLTTSSCKCDDQPLKDENARLLGETQNLSKTKTEQEGKITELTTTNANLMNERNSLANQLGNQRERIIQVINEEIRRRDEAIATEQTEINKIRGSFKPDTPKVMRVAGDDDIKKREATKKRLGDEKSLLTALSSRINTALAVQNSSSSGTSR